jgi:hypothetical protein
VGSIPASPAIALNIEGMSKMKKWWGLIISLFLLIGMVSVSISPNIFKKAMPRGVRSEGYQTILVQNEEKEEKKGETDPHLILILKEIQKKLDEWLKKLNERIESEDITRFEIRFLEILRNILEWIKEKIDAKIESAEREKPARKEKKGIFREIRQRDLLFSKMG